MATLYYAYTAFNETLSKISETTNTKADEIIRINDQKYSDTKTVGQILKEYQTKGKTLPDGMIIRIPIPNSGGKENPPEVKYTVKSPGYVAPVAKSRFNINCSIIIYQAGAVAYSMALPVYPQEFADKNSVSFDETSIFGRSVAYQTYNTSSRSVSFTLQLHEEICNDVNYIHSLVSRIESACYPAYGGSGNVSPPEVKVFIGRQFSCRGILQGCSATWKPPIIDDRYVNCDLSLDILETTGPYGMSQVAAFQGRR